MPKSVIAEARRKSSANVMLTIGIMALAAVAMAIGIRLHADALGLPEDLARLVATALLACAVVDLVALQVWDRVFHSPPREE
jgi:hypothetical protein